MNPIFNSISTYCLENQISQIKKTGVASGAPPVTPPLPKGIANALSTVVSI